MIAQNLAVRRLQFYGALLFGCSRKSSPAAPGPSSDSPVPVPGVGEAGIQPDFQLWRYPLRIADKAIVLADAPKRTWVGLEVTKDCAFKRPIWHGSVDAIYMADHLK